MMIISIKTTMRGEVSEWTAEVTAKGRHEKRVSVLLLLP